MKVISIYDPTATDEQSRVRGVGRYFSTLQELVQSTSSNSPGPTQGVSPFRQSSTNPADDLFFQKIEDTKKVKKEHIFLNPFFNPIQKPLKIRRIAHKQIAVIHDLIPFKYPSHFPIGIQGHINTFLNKWSLKNYDLIITDSLASKRDIMHFYKLPEQKVKIIYPTVSRVFLPHMDTAPESATHHHPFHKEKDVSVAEFTALPLEHISKNPALQNLKEFVLYVGDATWNKNLAVVAHAIKMANVPCVFVGNVFGQKNSKKIITKPNPWQKSLSQFLGLAQGDSRFIFPGFVSDIELLELYKRSRANILVSQDEGFGFSYIEAGFMSTPSVLSDIPIFHEIAGEAADFASPHDPKEIAQKIVELFYDQIKHEKMGIKAFDRAQEYHPRKFQKAWLDTLSII